MYIQITTRCNMSCDHCSFSCNPTSGEHMNKRTYKQALEFCENYGSSITLGGGEPTIHPRFWEFFGLALGSTAEFLWMATNGKRKEIAIALAKLARGNDYFDIALSTDRYHDPIDPAVIKKFIDYDLELRDVTKGWGIINKGAAFENGVGAIDACTCQDMLINPQGDVYMCGCPDSLRLGQLGIIDDTIITRARTVGEDTNECGAVLTPEQVQYILFSVPISEEEAA